MDAVKYYQMEEQHLILYFYDIKDTQRKEIYLGKYQKNNFYFLLNKIVFTVEYLPVKWLEPRPEKVNIFIMD